ncbi:RED-like protein [Mya arenaria]|uniref:RED-like protein n=1 Tax=Mya arenaria TaxID=6604 RepID=A0ABY7DX23_MYAAR|nr:RED-like protein [Mya arenaria]
MPERPEMERMDSFSNPIAPPEVMIEDLEGDDQQQSEANIEDGDDPAERRRKKKIYYAKLKRLEEERQKELAEKYRDRARERRDGQHSEHDQADTISTTADYRAVAPDAKSVENLAERRKQVIQESKYLGGDMEHTHLVKGLDYALLEKVRAEITTKEREEEQQMEDMVDSVNPPSKEEKKEDPEEHMQFKTKIGRNIFRTLFKPKELSRNELFMPGRMAYTTATLTTNDIVINKLTQILSYLRQGRRESKKLKKLKGKLREAEKMSKMPGADDNIYADLADYNPSVGKGKDRRDRKDRDRDDRRDRDRDRERDRRDRDRDRDRRDRDRERERERGRDDRKRKSYFEKPAEEDEDRQRSNQNVKDLKEEERRQRLQKKLEEVGYAECYPGMMETADAMDDSDDEVDYTKMDQGNKKGPVGRWDFDTQEEYSEYMSNKEALPKAAFQYGVKMSDGRKTRRAGPKDEKAELDRQWQQIQNIMNKRKGGDSGFRDDSKKSKY